MKKSILQMQYDKLEIAETLLCDNSRKLATVSGRLCAFNEMEHTNIKSNDGKDCILIPKDIIEDLLNTLVECRKQSSEYYGKCVELFNN
tara:strand:+ start:976 stop:1242 length:267 start_codon:yes stop_codon:yes gene_type:complete